MNPVLALVLTMGLFLVLEWFWRRLPSPPADDPAGRDRLRGAPPPVEGLLTSAFVQHRIRALAAELERLDRDPSIFARAFHTRATRTAYEALLAEARRTAATTLPPDVVLSPGPVRAEREEIEI